MNFVIRNLPKSEIEIEVTIPPSELEPHVKTAANLISEEITIEGFRKGKAPYEVVKQRVGESAIYDRAADIAVRKTYIAALESARDKKQEAGEDFTPIGKPEVTVMKLAPQNDLVYKTKVALLPPVILPDYKAIARKVRGGRREATVSDEEVDKAITWLRESRMKLVTVSRKAEKGDRVEVDFEIRHGGAKIENGESKNHPLVLGENRFLPGFEDELTGLAAGEKKDFTLRMPEDWRDKQFAGKALDIAAEVKLVVERQMPELDDAFAKSIGEFASLDALKTKVREGLVQEKTEKETQRIRSAMIEEIAEETRVEIPDALITSEIKKIQEEFKAGITEMGMKWEDYLLHIKKTLKDLESEWRGEAEKRVRVALTLRKIAESEAIVPSDEEIEERTQRILSQFRNADQAERTIDPRELHDYTQGILKNEKVFEFLEKII